MSVASSSSDRQNPPVQPRRSRLLLKLSLGALLVLVLLVAAAPTLLSSGPGRNLILGMANERVAGSVAIDDLSLRWFGPQRIVGLRLADPAGDPVVTVAEFKTGLSLLQALRGRLGLGETLIRGLRVELALDPSGQDNLEAAIGLAQQPGAPSGPLLIPVTGGLVLEQGYLSWSAPGIEAVIIEDLAARVRLDPSSRDLALDLSARSRQGDMSGSLAVSGTLRQWLDASGRLTPALLARWLDAETPASRQIRLAEAAPVRLVLERLEAGLADPGLSALQFDGSAAIGRMRFRSGNQVLAALDQLDVGLQWQGSQGRGGVSVDGRVSADGGEPGVINGSLALDSLRPDGSGNLNLDLDLTQLPLVVVDRFLGMDGMVTATLGRTMEGTLQGELREGQGPLTLGIRGSNASADLKAHWNQGSLTLREPLMAEVQPTPEFGRLVLARVHPLFETLRGGKELFRFVMPAEGVLIPLIDFDLKNVRVPEMRLSLGRVELTSGWLLQGLVTLGQRFGTLRSVGDRWPAEFTPAVVSVADGQLTFTRRMDVLLGDQMHLATWGAMDLVTQRADLVLGVMPLTLRSVFSVAAAEDDALRIAVRGQPGPGAVDFSSIGIELARLQAQRRLGGSSPLLGALLGTVTGSTPGLSGAPAPSMSPLPWAERLK
ncbi:MAG: hypothetical protein R6W95_18680 [Desulfosarcina sp.]